MFPYSTLLVTETLAVQLKKKGKTLDQVASPFWWMTFPHMTKYSSTMAHMKGNLSLCIIWFPPNPFQVYFYMRKFSPNSWAGRSRKSARIRKRSRRVYAQTSFYQENLAFCFQLCTVTHFVGFLPLPWVSCSLVFFPYSWIRFGRFFVFCMEKKVGGLYLIVCKNYNSLTCLNVFFAIFNFENI